MRLYHVKDKKSNTIMIRQDFKNSFKNINGRNELTIKNCTIKTSNDSIPYTVSFEDSEHKIIKNVFIWIKTNDENEVFDSFRYSYCKLRLTYLEFISLKDRLKEYDSTKEYDISFSYIKQKDSLVIKFKESNIKNDIKKVEEPVKEEIINKPIKINEEQKIKKEQTKLNNVNSFYTPKGFSFPSREERIKLCSISSRSEHNDVNIKDDIEEEFEVA